MPPELSMETPFGAFLLDRRPPAGRRPLRAWDAADELALQHVSDRLTALPAEPQVMIVNDTWGALSVALAGLRPTAVIDSHLARTALAANLIDNGLAPDSVAVVASVEEAPDRADLVVLRLPKSGDLLAHQLHLLAPRCEAGTLIVAAAMARHIHRSTLDALERRLGPTVTTRATKKARLALVTRDPDLDPGPSPWPRRFTAPSEISVVHHAGVFGGPRLDPGTRLLLAHLPEPGQHRAVVDLGCGNGVLGAAIARRDPHAEVTFVDDSSAAVASARASFEATLGPEREAHFAVGDCLNDLEGIEIAPRSIDLVITNPPFHQDHTVGDATAWQMVDEAHRALRPGGELRLVGNRHLGHHAKLSRRFGHCEVVASDPRYVVVRATR